MAKQSSIWIVIVNYRTADLVVSCLRALSVQLSNFEKIRVVVVDNNSGDGSVPKLAAAIDREDWSTWAELMPLDKNGGFAYGNNASIRIALADSEPNDYIMLLNPDTVPLPGAINILLDYMNAHPDVGIVGSQLENADGVIENSAHRFPSFLTEFDSAARLGVLSRLLNRYVSTPPATTVAQSCDWVSGASMLIRRKLIEDIGLMDEEYFLYFEEVDFCRRAAQSGWKCWQVPDSRVVHLEGASTGIHTTEKRRPGYWYDSRRRFFVKHYGVSVLMLADGLWAIGRLSFLIRKKLHLGARSQANSDPKWFMFDLLWGDLRALFTGRLWHISSKGKPI